MSELADQVVIVVVKVQTLRAEWLEWNDVYPLACILH